MKTKLFENIEGNRFKLLTENQSENESYVASGLKKVFLNADGNVSYRQVETVGLGYIRDINAARRFALQEAREIAESFGYKDNEEEAKFIKDSPNVRQLKKEEHGESDVNNPEENREVQIGQTIIDICDGTESKVNDTNAVLYAFKRIKAQASELIKIHGQKTVQTKKPMSGWDNLQLGSH